jgi:hypothetical protein
MKVEESLYVLRKIAQYVMVVWAGRGIVMEGAIGEFCWQLNGF